MQFIKLRTLPNEEEQIINISQIKRIVKDGQTAFGENRYEIKFSGTDIKISQSEAEKLFEVIGCSF